MVIDHANDFLEHLHWRVSINSSNGVEGYTRRPYGDWLCKWRAQYLHEKGAKVNQKGWSVVYCYTVWWFEFEFNSLVFSFQNASQTHCGIEQWGVFQLTLDINQEIEFTALDFDRQLVRGGGSQLDGTHLNKIIVNQINMPSAATFVWLRLPKVRRAIVTSRTDCRWWEWCSCLLYAV